MEQQDKLQFMPPNTTKRVLLATRENMALLEAVFLLRQQHVIMLYRHGFTLEEGARGSWLCSMGCHPLFSGAMVDSRAAFGMTRVLSDLNRVLKQRHQGQRNQPDR